MVKLLINKPKYVVPSMREINAMSKNGFKAISLFAGADGSCLGLKIAGFEVVWASEFIPIAADTHLTNFAGCIVDRRDIRLVDANDVLNVVGLKKGELDLLNGSPPCESFSTAGKREKKWGKVCKYSETKQRMDDLFFEFVRLVDGIKSRMFVAENVMGLVVGVSKGYFKEILAAMKDVGYVVAVKLLNAKWLGVPQSRRRLFFVGVRNDLGFEPEFPKPLPYYYTVRDAISDLSNAYVEPECDMNGYANGRLAVALKEGCGDKKRFNLRRLAFDKSSETIAAIGGGRGTASILHPSGVRKPSIAELKRLCSFPDDFVLLGTYAQQWERLGNSVPPMMMKHVACAIRDSLMKVR